MMRRGAHQYYRMQSVRSSALLAVTPAKALLNSIGAQGLSIDFSSINHYARDGLYGDAVVVDIRDALALLFGLRNGLALAFSDTYFVASDERYGSAEVIA